MEKSGQLFFPDIFPHECTIIYALRANYFSTNFMQTKRKPANQKIEPMKLRILFLLCIISPMLRAQLKPDNFTFPPVAWKSEAPADCPFPASKEITGITLLGVKSGFHFGDTWYPTWADDGNLYSPWTDGCTWRLDGSYDCSSSFEGDKARTGQAVIEGDDPSGQAGYGDQLINWPWMGPFVGFRTSKDYGRTWTETPHTPEKPLFGETGINGYPVKIGSPHFVDFGRNLQYSIEIYQR